MPIKDNHLSLAIHDLDVLCHLSQKPEFSDWIVTVGCYTAIHLIEALFAVDNGVRSRIVHSTAHSERNQILQRCYPDIWKKYRLLYDASLVARYLNKDGLQGQSFDCLYSFDFVVTKLIKNCLAGVIKRVESASNGRIDMAPVHQQLQRCFSILNV